MNISSSPFQPQLSPFPIRTVSIPSTWSPYFHPGPSATQSSHSFEKNLLDINPITSLPLLQIFQCFLKIVSKLIRRASHNLAPNTASTSIHRLFLSPHPLTSATQDFLLSLELTKYSSWRSLIPGSFLSLRYQLKYYLSFKRHLSPLFLSTKVSQASSITSHCFIFLTVFTTI